MYKKLLNTSKYHTFEVRKIHRHYFLKSSEFLRGKTHFVIF